jgi:hypothetical protein
MDEATGDLVTTDPSRGNHALLFHVQERGRWRLVSAEMWSANADAIGRQRQRGRLAFFSE